MGAANDLLKLRFNSIGKHNSMDILESGKMEYGESTRQRSDYLELRNLLSILKNRRYVILACFLICGVLALVISCFIMRKQYTSTADLYVTSGIDIEASRSLAETLVVLLGNASVEKTVAETQGIGLPVETLRKYVKIAAASKTEVVRITVISPDPELSALICDTYAEIAAAELKRVTEKGSVLTLAPALTAERPSGPNVIAITGAGFIAGLIISVIYCCLSVSLGSAADAQSLAKSAGLPLLSEIPPERSKKSKNPPPLLSKESGSAIYEAFIRLRTELLLDIAPKNIKIIMAACAQDTLGKSRVLANLAVSLSFTGKRVILLDANLRYPRQEELFAVYNPVGLSNLLSEKDSALNAAILKNVRPYLDLLPAGATKQKPSELLSAKSAANLINVLAKYYDYILIDTPPVPEYSDALLLMNENAGVIIVSPQKTADYENLLGCINKCAKTGASILGLCVTD